MRHLILHRGLVLLAGFILCLHTIFPHVHVGEGSETEVAVFSEESAETRSLLDVLYELVTADLGEEHLENFTPASSEVAMVVLVLPPALLPLTPWSYPGHLLVANESHTKEVIALPPLLPEEADLVRQCPLRGPPAVG